MSRAIAIGAGSGPSPSASTPKSPRRKTVSPARSATGNTLRGEISAYFRASETPLAALVFLLPFIVLYEIGTRKFLYDPIHGTEQRIIAFDQLQRLFRSIGANLPYMPAILVIGMLLIWHLFYRGSTRGSTWRIGFGQILAMFVESGLLAIPLLLIGMAVTRWLSHTPHSPLVASWHSSRGLLVLSLGAGIYEELVFRLLGFLLLSILFTNVFKCRNWMSGLLMVLISAIAFSGYHYLGDEPFRWRTFTFRAVAGAYFGVVFLCRGFGITAGTHIAYDVLIVLMRVAG